MGKIQISKLKSHPRNNYFFDDIGGDAWETFLNSIRTSGIIDPIVITDNNMIVSGHQRVRACKELGIDEIPYVYCEDNPCDDNLKTFMYIDSNMEYVINRKRFHNEYQMSKCVGVILNYAVKRNKLIKDIKLRHYQLHRNYVSNNRNAIIKNHGGGVCQICGNSCGDILHIHFRVPLEEWGNSNDENLIAVCPNCHGIIHKYIDSISSNNEAIYGEVGVWVQNNYSYTANINLINEFQYYIHHRSNYSIEKALTELDSNKGEHSC